MRPAVTCGSRRPEAGKLTCFARPAGGHLFVVNESRLFDIDAELFGQVGAAMQSGAVGALLDELGLGGPRLIDDQPLSEPPLRALSLAIAQKCNLGCAYCYAQQGDFGVAPRNMTLEVANRAVDLLLADAPAGTKLNLAFLGGEPLVNRGVLRSATQRAAALARDAGVTLTFSITTNGTLLTPEDAVFFEAFGFAVTVSLDGPRQAHDALRPYKSGGGSFDRVMKNLEPFLTTQRRMQVSARVTVTPANLSLRQTLDQFLAVGFHSVGFSPLLSAPGGGGEMQAANALRELERGTHRPYPCGAGAGYSGFPPRATWRRAIGLSVRRGEPWEHWRTGLMSGGVRSGRPAPRSPAGALPRLLGAVSLRGRVSS